MGLRGLDFQLRHIPFSAGLNTKGDARAQNPPYLDICRDAEFDDIGGLRPRKPYTALATNIIGGGSLADVRRIAPNGDELLLWTKDSLYSYSDAAPQGWAFKATDMAVAVDEADAFDAPTDQHDADRAELAGVVFTTWTDVSGTWIAARDKDTNAIIAPPAMIVGSDVTRPRLVALSTKVLFTFIQVDHVFAVALDPADPVGTIGGGNVPSATNVFGGGNQGPYYDIVRIGATDTAALAMQHAGLASYDVAIVTAGLVMTTVNKARACQGPIAIAVSPDAAHLQIAYFIGLAPPIIHGDLLDAVTLADVNSAILIAAPYQGGDQLTCAYSSTAVAGQFRCYCFWNKSSGTALTVGTYPAQVASTWVDTAGATGGGVADVNDLLITQVELASSAFSYDGHVYVWTVFDQTSSAPGANAQIFKAQLQNTYFLYREDGLLCAVSCDAVAAGATSTVAHLPSVASTDGATSFAWCGSRKRRVNIGAAPQIGYSDERTPRDITFSFDDNRARRSVRFGRTLYKSGGEIMQYDGIGLYEVGFHVYPWHIGLADDAAAGAVEQGAYAYKMTWRWPNAQGESERSTTATVTLVNVAANNHQVSYATNDHNLGLCQTHKTAAPPIAELWRTQKNPVAESPFYLASATAYGTTGPNGYLRCDPIADPFVLTFGIGPQKDSFADATLSLKQANPENDGTLENLAPPPATIVLASSQRLFLAGVAGDPHRVWYSKLRNEGEVAAFNDINAADVPPAGGKLTALGFDNETLVAFRERAIYMLPGEGYDNTGSGTNYGPARVISSDVGCVSAEALALAPFGLFFKSSKGWYRLGRDWNVQYIGAAVAKFDGDTVLSVHVVESQHQIRCLTNQRLIVFDYLVNEWAESTAGGPHLPINPLAAVDACMWKGRYVLLAPFFTLPPVLVQGLPVIPPNPANVLSGPVIEAPDFASATGYGIDAETSWIKVADQQGHGVVRNIQILGEFRSACRVRIRIARDYQMDGAGNPLYVDDVSPLAAPTVVGGPLQLRHGPSQKRCQAIKVRLTVIDVDGVSPAQGEGVKLTGLVLDVGTEPGMFGNLAAAQKT